MNRVYHGFNICRIFAQTDEISHDDKRHLSHVPEALRNIATYYEDKHAALLSAQARARGDISEFSAMFNNLVRRKDYKNLLPYFENFAVLMELDDPIPSSPPGTASIAGHRRDQHRAAAFKAEIDFASEGGLHILSWLGRPTKLKDLEKEIEICQINMQRNQPVQAAVMSIADQIDRVLNEHRGRSNVIHLGR